jgi:hypothetical protein
MNHHHHGRNHRNKFCEDDAPHGNHEKISRIDLVKQRSGGLYLEDCNLLTSLTLERDCRRRDNRRLLIVDDALHLRRGYKDNGYQNLTNLLKRLLLLKTSRINWVLHSPRTPARPAEGGETDL